MYTLFKIERWTKLFVSIYKRIVLFATLTIFNDQWGQIDLYKLFFMPVRYKKSPAWHEKQG